MAQFRVGCVPYVNARPLVAAFDQPNEFVEVVYAVPSALPALLDSGEVDAILVSSIELLRRDDLLPVAEVGIMSNGPVRSVRMLSTVPLTDIKSLALDQSSMTSNILAQVILAEQGVFPHSDLVAPDAKDMLANHDACVIIGDKGFEADGTGLIDIDLGNAWTDMTGLPFVWAMWLGKKEAKLNSKLLFWLLQCAYNASGFRPLHDFIDPQGKYASDYKKEYVESHCQKTKSRRSFVIESAVRRSSWTHEQVDEYLSYGVRFDEPKAQYALEKFAELINKHRIAEVEIPLELRSEELRKIVMDMIPEIA